MYCSKTVNQYRSFDNVSQFPSRLVSEKRHFFKPDFYLCLSVVSVIALMVVTVLIAIFFEDITDLR